MQKIDFGKTAKDYAQYREGFPQSLIIRLQMHSIGLKNQKIVDIGTGTGTLARHFAEFGAKVCGIDIAKELLEQAKELDKLSRVSIDYLIGSAEQLPFADSSKDVITAGQCWHWFDGNLTAKECFRVLKPGGALVICHFDWIPLPENVVELTESIILKHNPFWKMGGGTGLYPRWLLDVSTHGFQHLETFSYDHLVTYSHERWRGRIRASAGVSATLSLDQVAHFDSEHKFELYSKFPEDTLNIPHRVWVLIARKPWG